MCPKCAMEASLGFILCIIPLVGFAAGQHILPYAEEDLHSDGRVSALFDAWNHKHGKQNPDVRSREREERLEIFKENLRHIHAHNSRNSSSYTLGLTRFADLTNAEFKALNYFGFRTGADRALDRPLQSRRRSELLSSDPAARRGAASCAAESLDSDFDWRDRGAVESVKDQGSCGSGWAFASVGAIESANAIATGTLVSLSEQELVSCVTNACGCGGGRTDYAFEFVIQNGGIASEADYPYTSSSGRTGKCDLNKLGNQVVQIDLYEHLPVDDESSLTYAVASQPVTVVLNGDAFDFQLYSGGVYDGSCSNREDDLDHAILITGWGEENGVQYWTGKNSWGTSWGEEGYIKLVRCTGITRGICGMYSMPSYPIASSSSPPPPSPPLPPASPPPPPPSSVQCDDRSSCRAGETCCCSYPYGRRCLYWVCCPYENAVCCDDHNGCCPHDYPVCGTRAGHCYKDRLSSSHPWARVEAKENHPAVQERHLGPSEGLVRVALD